MMQQARGFCAAALNHETQHEERTRDRNEKGSPEAA
jgi:hypothetical protein